MTTIYNYIINKINQLEVYLLQPYTTNTTKHNKTQKYNTTLKSPEYYDKVIDELQQQIKERLGNNCQNNII